MTNQDIRRAAAGEGVRLWQIAEVMGIEDCSRSRKLRKETSPERKPVSFPSSRGLPKTDVIARILVDRRGMA